MICKNLECLRKRKKRNLVGSLWYSELTDYWSSYILTNHWQCPCVEQETEKSQWQERLMKYFGTGWLSLA